MPPLHITPARLLVDQAVDGEAQRQFAALAGVAADQRAAGFIEHLDGAGHHLEQRVLDLASSPGGTVAMAVADCGSAPMAKMSPSAWLAAMRPKPRGRR
jgi:hypothetical protein